MSTNEVKFNELVEAMGADIHSQQQQASVALHSVERFNISAEEFKKANVEFATHTTIAGYLAHIRAMIENGGDLKSADMVLRFHAQAQHNKGSLFADCESMTLCQRTITATLERYVRFIDAE